MKKSKSGLLNAKFAGFLKIFSFYYCRCRLFYLPHFKGSFTLKLKFNPSFSPLQAWAFSWDDKKAGVQLLLAQLTKKESYKNAIKASLDNWLPGGSVRYTPKGLAWRIKWGSNRYAANTAFLALVAADQGLKRTAYRNFAKKQINYMLGDSGRSFVVGFGKNSPRRPHHSSSSCPSAPQPCGWDNFNADILNAHVLKGALVGGPDENDNYKDDRKDYVMNEVTTDYNAGFQSSVAGLKQLEL